jgi:glycosyltransferase involved in cell wall biosynthesis
MVAGRCGQNVLMITIITATYNADDQLRGLIASLRAQTDRAFEWIVVDGASTDSTTQLLAEAGDVVTRWKSEPDFGIYDALNKALRMTQTEYYLVLGADDRLEPCGIEVYKQEALRSGADVVTGAVAVDGAVVRPRRAQGIRSGSPLVSSHSVGALIRRALHDEIGLYSRRFPIAADTHFLLQVAQRGKRVAIIDDVVGSFSTDGVSGRDLLGSLCESYRANVEVRGGLLRHTAMLVLRVLKNRGRLVGR